MDVKKYMGYLPLCMLSIIIVFSLLVYSKRNDFAIGLKCYQGFEILLLYHGRLSVKQEHTCTGKHMARGCGWGYIYNHL